MRRSLGAHPESLTRSLRRLERTGLVEKTADGYALIHPASPVLLPVPSVRWAGRWELPPGMSRDSVLGELAGRWFGDLRWVGLFDRYAEPWLVWTAEGS